MNEELQKALVELLSKANSGIDAASGFLVAELPEVIQQLLMWHGIYNFIMMMVAVACISIASTLYVKVIKNLNNKDHWATNSTATDFSPSGGLSLILSIVLIIVFFFCMNIEWLQIWIAPKLWLLEYAAQLTK